MDVLVANLHLCNNIFCKQRDEGNFDFVCIPGSSGLKKGTHFYPGVKYKLTLRGKKWAGQTKYVCTRVIL